MAGCDDAQTRAGTQLVICPLVRVIRRFANASIPYLVRKAHQLSYEKSSEAHPLEHEPQMNWETTIATNIKGMLKWMKVGTQVSQM